MVNKNDNSKSSGYANVKVLSLFDGMACLIEATRRNETDETADN